MASTGLQYERLDITDSFHQLPHLGADLKAIRNSTFNPENEDYIKSIAVFVGLPIAVMVLILILYLLTTIVMCCCCTDGKKRTIIVFWICNDQQMESNREPRSANEMHLSANEKQFKAFGRTKDIRTECKVIIFLFGLVGGLSFVVGLYGDWKIHESVESVKNSTQDAVQLFNSIKNETNWATMIVKDANGNVNDLNKAITKFTNKLPLTEDLKEKMENYINIGESVGETLRKTSAEVSKVNGTINSKETSKVINDIPDQIENYGKLFCIIALAVLLALALVGLVFTCAICSRCFLGCVTVLGVIAFILGSIIVGASFGASVGVSDFCVDGDKWIRSEINDKDVSDYIECVGGYNAISNYLGEAQKLLDQAHKEYKTDLAPLNDTLTSICNQVGSVYKCDQDLVNEIKNNIGGINNNVNSLIDLLAHFMEIAQCDRISYDLKAVMSSVCTDAIKGVAMIFFNTIASSVCFAILLFSATFALR